MRGNKIREGKIQKEGQRNRSREAYRIRQKTIEGYRERARGCERTRKRELRKRNGPKKVQGRENERKN